MATPNYGYEKRQRELAKRQKKEEKLRAKASRKPGDPLGEGENRPEGDPAAPAGEAGQGQGGAGSAA